MTEAERVKVYILPLSEAKKVPEEYCLEHFPQRLERSRDFTRGDDRLRCIGAGGLIHRVLGLEERDIMTAREGKPYSPSCLLHFNLSHSGEYVLLAVSSCNVGADIEQHGRMTEKVARRVFTPAELKWLEQEPEERFTVLWTLKEAVTKALGRGLYLPFGAFEVLPLLRGESIVCGDAALYGQTFSLPGYCGAVCTVGRPCTAELIPFDWE